MYHTQVDQYEWRWLEGVTIVVLGQVEQNSMDHWICLGVIGVAKTGQRDSAKRIFKTARSHVRT